MECGLFGNFLLTWPRRICLSSTCPEIPVKSCFFDPSLFEVIRMFQPCACTWSCNTKTSASPVLLTVFSVLCLVGSLVCVVLHFAKCHKPCTSFEENEHSNLRAQTLCFLVHMDQRESVMCTPCVRFFERCRTTTPHPIPWELLDVNFLFQPVVVGGPLPVIIIRFQSSDN